MFWPGPAGSPRQWVSAAETTDLSASSHQCSGSTRRRPAVDGDLGVVSSQAWRYGSRPDPRAKDPWCSTSGAVTTRGHPPPETRDLRRRRPHEHRPEGHRARRRRVRRAPVGALHGPADAGPRPVPLPGVLAAARRWACGPRSSTSIPATNATRTYYLDVGPIHRRTPSVWTPRTTIWTWSSAPAPRVELIDVDELFARSRKVCYGGEPEGRSRPPLPPSTASPAHDYDLGRWLRVTYWCSPGGRKVSIHEFD